MLKKVHGFSALSYGHGSRADENTTIETNFPLLIDLMERPKLEWDMETDFFHFLEGGF